MWSNSTSRRRVTTCCTLTRAHQVITVAAASPSFTGTRSRLRSATSASTAHSRRCVYTSLFDVILMSIYRPPSAVSADFWDDLSNLLDQLALTGLRHVVCQFQPVRSSSESETRWPASCSNSL